ncbi:MAG: sigma-70 family RNA polymerase sigma factor [Clostridiales bacterium]|nr:sigma-70 family RNA polymerase sigma factor [Clostridiales bacterium]
MDGSVTESQFLHIWKCYHISRDEKLKEQLILSRMPLIRAVSARAVLHCPKDMDLEDINGYAVLGFIEALDRFDPRVHTSFPAFAVCWMRGRIAHGAREHAGIKRSQIKYLTQTISLNTGTAEEELLERIADPEDALGDLEDRLAMHQLHSLLEKQIAKLEPRQQMIIRRHYYEKVSLRRLGQDLGCSPSWISFQHRQALERLRESVGREPLFAEEKSQYLA